ncbi:hypothetical protein [Natronorubrum halophilum]|uniref:hypothetical protein n=1 Tax=Natronorubrum halophilum TaxID=1702106 RepID=UPI0013CEE884|nr:hypothetical protein [Natronorubrum halophilum]
MFDEHGSGESPVRRRLVRVQLGCEPRKQAPVTCTGALNARRLSERAPTTIGTTFEIGRIGAISTIDWRGFAEVGDQIDEVAKVNALGEIVGEGTIGGMARIGRITVTGSSGTIGRIAIRDVSDGAVVIGSVGWVGPIDGIAKIDAIGVIDGIGEMGAIGAIGEIGAIGAIGASSTTPGPRYLPIVPTRPITAPVGRTKTIE